MVGSHPVLGSWDLGEAPDMTWTDGHVWVSDLGVPEGADFEFKIVHLTYGGASWEPSSNRCACLHVPAAALFFLNAQEADFLILQTDVQMIFQCPRQRQNRSA